MKFLKKFGKKLCSLIILVTLFLIVNNKIVLAADYEIKNFESEINLNQDYSLTIKEKVEANFLIAKHGIYRVIPYIYSHKGKTIKADLRILKITDKNGWSVPYEVTNYNQSKKIKIGDSEKTIIGQQEYVIEYKVDQVVLDYGNGPEIYWNVTGKEWDTVIEKARAKVVSPFGGIIKTECFGCESSLDKNEVTFDGTEGLTIVVQIDKNNQLKSPGLVKKITNFIEGNWGYLLAVIPTFLMAWVWYKKGRDKKYLSDNIYAKPENAKEKNVSIFDRPHLPLVYAPIKGLSSAEIGTIVDQKIDINDVVSEIIELARLGFLKIKKTEKKKILGIKETDYELIKIDKIITDLNDFQKNLLDSLFGDLYVIKISDLKNKFYKKLPKLRSDIYSELEKKGISDGNWEKIQGKWIGIVFILNFLAIFLIISLFLKTTGNAGPMVVAIIGFIPSIILAIKMPRRTAWGYSLYRQITGLKYYLGKGKWREEIMEKNLFLEEMLPIAISLGVVNQLTNDMKDLEIEPPKYFEGVVINNFAHDLNSFSSSVTTNLTSTPSGNSSWSGGSGFSGGSGGGFGGGGGGSW
jgi:transposase